MQRIQTRNMVVSCTQSTTRLQAIADLLLLSDEAWPVVSQLPHCDSFHACRTLLLEKIHDYVTLMEHVKEGFCSQTTPWWEVPPALQSVQEILIDITHLSAHCSYLLAQTMPGCRRATRGLVDHYKLRRSLLDVRMCANLMRISSHEQLIPPVLVDVAACLSENLSRISGFCVAAASSVTLASEREQLRACVRSMSACGSCVMTAVRLFKATPDDAHLRRCLAFFDALVANLSATETLLSETRLAGRPAALSKDASDRRKKILSEFNVVTS